MFDQQVVTGGAPLSSELPASPREIDVVAIMCTRSVDGQPGFPAFDTQDKCVGFYAQDDQPSATRLRFIAIEDSSMESAFFVL